MRAKALIFTALCFTLLNSLSAVDKRCTKDYKAVEDFLNSKRIINFADKEKYLKISGDIRATYLDRCETHNNKALRGHGATIAPNSRIPIPHKTYEAVLNLRFDYKNGTKSWAAAYMTMDNPMGISCAERECSPKKVDDKVKPRSCGNGSCGAITIPAAENKKIDNCVASGSGHCNDLCLKRCYGGINLYDCKGVKLDVEIGRRPMYTIFDSRIEFHARFDGLLFKLSDFIKGWGNYYANGGPFVVDYRVDHYNYIVEVGIIDFYEVGIDIKYSFIDWKGKNKCREEDPVGFRFQNSQWSLAYNFSKDVIPRKMKLYSAFLVNHAARPFIFNGEGEPKLIWVAREHVAWYAGFILGEVKKKNDWSLDVNYQYVQPQAIMDCDVHGIGRGNLLKESFSKNLRGKANYKGWHIEGLYALTDKVSLDLLFEHSKEVRWRVGGRHTFTQTEFDVIITY